MKYVNILNSSPVSVFLRQIDIRHFEDAFCFFENSGEDRVWDYVVVYEEIICPMTVRHQQGGLLFFSGESQDSRAYGQSFLNQFDCVVASHANLRHRNHVRMQTGLNWHFGYNHKNQSFRWNFEELAAMPPPVKDKNISVITSTLAMMPGHIRRQRLISRLRERFGDAIDFFGKGVRFVDDKAEALLPYRFHVCPENSTRDDYWTEKLADPILAFSVPIYAGPPNLSRYFDPEAFYVLDINDLDGACAVVEEILKDPQRHYLEKLPLLLEARRRLLSEHNFFPLFERIVSEEVPLSDTVRETILYPNGHFWDGKLQMWWLRLRRFLFKKLHQ